MGLLFPGDVVLSQMIPCRIGGDLGRPPRSVGILFVIGGLSAVCSGGDATALAADQPDRDEAGVETPHPSAHDQEVAEAKERLQAAAAEFGTDPTAVVGYYEFYYEHDHLSGDERSENVVAVVSLALTPS